jgi:hypothetical protein
MAIDDDPLLIELSQLRDDQSSIVKGVRDTSIRVVLSASLPHVVPLIAGLLGDIAQKRWNDRVVELLIQFAKRLNELSPQRQDQSFYESTNSRCPHRHAHPKRVDWSRSPQRCTLAPWSISIAANRARSCPDSPLWRAASAAPVTGQR